MCGINWEEKVWSPLEYFFKNLPPGETLRPENIANLSPSDPRVTARILIYLFGQINFKQISENNKIPHDIRKAYKAEFQQLSHIFRENIKYNLNHLCDPSQPLILNEETRETRNLLSQRSAYSVETPQDLINRKIVEYLASFEMPSQVARITGCDRIPAVWVEIQKMESDLQEALSLLEKHFLDQYIVLDQIGQKTRWKYQAIWCQRAALRRIDDKDKTFVTWMDLATEWGMTYTHARHLFDRLTTSFNDLHTFLPKTKHLNRSDQKISFRQYFLMQTFQYFSKMLDVPWATIYTKYPRSVLEFDQIRRLLIFFVDYLKDNIDQSKDISRSGLQILDKLVSKLDLPPALLEELINFLKAIHLYCLIDPNVALQPDAKEKLFNFICDIKFQSFPPTPENFFYEFMKFIVDVIKNKTQAQVESYLETYLLKEFEPFIPFSHLTELKEEMKSYRFPIFYYLSFLKILFGIKPIDNKVMSLSLEKPDYFKAGLFLIEKNCLFSYDRSPIRKFLFNCLHLFDALAQQKSLHLKPHTAFLLIQDLSSTHQQKLDREYLLKTLQIYFRKSPNIPPSKTYPFILFRILYNLIQHSPKLSDDFFQEFLLAIIPKENRNFEAEFSQIYEFATKQTIPKKTQAILKDYLKVSDNEQPIPILCLFKFFKILIAPKYSNIDFLGMALTELKRSQSQKSETFNFFHACLHFFNTIAHFKSLPTEETQRLFEGIWEMTLDDRMLFDEPIVEGFKNPIVKNDRISNFRITCALSTSDWSRIMIRVARSKPNKLLPNEPPLLNLDEMLIIVFFIESLIGCRLPQEVLRYFLLYQSFYSERLLKAVQNFLITKGLMKDFLNTFSLPSKFKKDKIDEPLNLFLAGGHFYPSSNNVQGIQKYIDEDLLPFKIGALTTLIQFIFQPYNYINLSSYMPNGIDSGRLIFDKMSEKRMQVLSRAHPDCDSGWFYACRWFYGTEKTYYFEMTMIQSLDDLNSVTFRVPFEISLDTLEKNPNLFPLLSHMTQEMVQETLSEEEEVKIEGLVWTKIPGNIRSIETADLTSMLPFYPHIQKLWNDLILNNDTDKMVIGNALFKFIKTVKEYLKKTTLSFLEADFLNNRSHDMRFDASRGCVYKSGEKFLLLAATDNPFYLVKSNAFPSTFKEVYEEMKNVLKLLNFKTLSFENFATLTVSPNGRDSLEIDVCATFIHREDMIGCTLKATNRNDLEHTIYYPSENFLDRFMIDEDDFKKLMLWQLAQLKSRFYLL